ncbi:MAG: nicotinate-nucleotide adenylyltransferase [bacterium]
MARIGLFGGTFNPIHVGHLTIAEEARLAAGLDRVIFIPTGESYLKNSMEVAPKEDRLQMTRLACGDVYEVSDVETRRDGPSYTAVTCRAFRQQFPNDELCWILGADSLLDMARWREPEVIMQTVTLLAFTRGGADNAAFLHRADDLRREQGAKIEIIETFALDIASSDIRRFIREGHAFRHLVTEKVYAYIRERGLYELKIDN